MKDRFKDSGWRHCLSLLLANELQTTFKTMEDEMYTHSLFILFHITLKQLEVTKSFFLKIHILTTLTEKELFLFFCFLSTCICLKSIYIIIILVS